MKIALIGYGKMGKTIEQIALDRGHTIVARIDPTTGEDFESEGFKTADVAIEFTAPTSAYLNYLKCFEHHIPVVSGTTGWLDMMDNVKQMCEKEGFTFFYASNFSLGVNIFFQINRQLARIMNRFSDYSVRIEETHHTQKLDAPSGTAITLAEGIIEQMDRENGWVLAPEVIENSIPITAIRRGDVPGIHTITYESEMDTISITHDAKSRKGFALGAVLAAEFVKNRKGFLGMNDLLNF
jgi:4-hydroxy-tetrahydrodipicolinate reductase